MANNFRYTEQAKEAGFRIEVRYNKSFVSALTMVLPPSQISYREPQRSTVIKTQGGSTVLDFGEDNKSITINGFAMRNMMFQIDKTDVKRKIGLDKSEMTGLEVFKYFKERVMRYKSVDAEKVKLYSEQTKDLSKFEVKFYDYWNDEYWIVNLDSFEWSEQSSQPTWINYVINMTTLEKFPKKERQPKKVVDAQSALEKAKQAMSDVKRLIYSAKRQLQQAIRNIKKFVADIESLVLSVDQILTAITEAGTMAIDTVSGILTTIDGIINILITAPFRTAAALLRSMRRLQTAMRSLGNTFIKKNEYIKQFSGRKGVGNSGVTGGAKEESNINQSQAEATIEGLLNSGGGKYIVKKGLSLQRIANNVFGNASLYPLIMIENNINITNVNVGQVLYMPSNDPRAKDAYLTDIKLNKDGMETVVGDLGEVSGVENVVETLLRRLKIEQGEYYRNDNLGVENVIGNPSSAFLRKVVRVNMLEAMLQDPRIASASEFQFVENASAYKFQAKLTLIAGEEITIKA